MKDIVNGKKEHAAVYSAILSILLVELRLLEIDREVHLDLIVASYVCFSGTTPEAIGGGAPTCSMLFYFLTQFSFHRFGYSNLSDNQHLIDL